MARVSRDESGTRFSHLPPDEVSAVWDDPVLRYSNVLQGLFHSQVVVCESDADCRFFGAALDELALAQNKRAIADDVLFVPSGGKQRVGAMADAVARLRVPSAAIVDFDALRNKADIKGIVAGVGADWTDEMELQYKKFIEQPNAKQSWDDLKHAGIEGLTAGDSYSACDALLTALAEVHVHVLRVGELEDLDKHIQQHGAAWVSAALEAGDHQSNGVQAIVAPFLQ